MLERTLGSSSSVATILLAFYPHHHHHHHHQHQYTFSPQNVTRYSPHLLRCKPPSCSKMFVPGFGEASPEAKAATNLHNFFTFLAVKIVLAQLQSYNPEAYEELMEFTSRNSLSDGDKYCANLMRESPRLQTIVLKKMTFALICGFVPFHNNAPIWASSVTQSSIRCGLIEFG
ncbi:chaperonin-like RBCX protein 1, chloroplastic isoform X2 [Magnolia sinica]|uniref:chaperonin-like RBCX protein 1, chloroplastic isoform X2 n=1 Tax=Magnolia sinica TaxID=86752 RepID=UPI0026591AEA|nr:chaperonin-like RBCX protein 1, chloroplastic isoform X2 [Magnolia sinica]